MRNRGRGRGGHEKGREKAAAAVVKVSRQGRLLFLLGGSQQQCAYALGVSL